MFRKNFNPSDKVYKSEQKGFYPPVVSNKTIYKSLLASSFLALSILTFIILPAEYNIDPTGVGLKLGLTKLTSPETENTIKVLAKTDHNALSFQSDTINITIKPGTGVEYKFDVQKNNSLNYSWESSDGELYFDLHGEPKGDTTGYFESYLVSSADKAKGSFIAPFDGSHGWYWENKGTKDVTITLNTEGDYQVLGLK